MARWLVSSLYSFSSLNLASSLSARIVAKPERVSEKWAYIGDSVTLISRFNSLGKEKKMIGNFCLPSKEFNDDNGGRDDDDNRELTK